MSALRERLAQKPIVKCEQCSDIGLIQLQDQPKAKWGWQLFFTTVPCTFCDLGRSFARTHEEGTEEFRDKWQARNN